MVAENSVVDKSSIKPVDKSSVLVKNTGLKLEELDEKAVVYQSVFSLLERVNQCCLLSSIFRSALRFSDIRLFE